MDLCIWSKAANNFSVQVSIKKKIIIEQIFYKILKHFSSVIDNFVSGLVIHCLKQTLS